MPQVGMVIPSYGSCPVARSQQQQIIATGKSNSPRPILPPISPYCVSVGHLRRPTLLDCVADILFEQLKHQDTCDTTTTYNNQESSLNFLCVENLCHFEIARFDTPPRFGF